MKSAKCGLCGKDPAEGWAIIKGVRYCHDDFTHPTCFMRKTWEPLDQGVDLSQDEINEAINAGNRNQGPAPWNRDLGTYKGKPITEEMIERWAEKFEAGIDPAKLRPRHTTWDAVKKARPQCGVPSALNHEAIVVKCQSPEHGREFPHYCWDDDRTWVLVWAWEGEKL